MIQFILQDYASRWEIILDASQKFAVRAGSPTGHEHLKPEEFRFLASVEADLQYICSAIQPETANVLLVEFGHITKHKPCSYQTISALLEGIVNAIRRDTGEIRFAFIPKEKVQFFDKGKNEPSVIDGPLFGEKVHKCFPQAREEIRSGGTCLALELHDAAVFHLMRVVEIGLRELGRKLGIRKIAKAPLDYAGWKKVVEEIEDKLAKKIQKVRGPKQSAELKFKQDLLADFKAFEVTRNEALHGRSRYNEQEAIGFFNRVREFMQRLETQISLSPAQERAKSKRDVEAIYKKVLGKENK